MSVNIKVLLKTQYTNYGHGEWVSTFRDKNILGAIMHAWKLEVVQKG